MIKNIKYLILILLLHNLVLPSSHIYCNEGIQDDSDSNYDIVDVTIPDPCEGLNRKFFIVNGILELGVVRPLAKMYRAVCSPSTMTLVSNFMTNLQTPSTVVNNALQAKPQLSLKALWRFLINSTLGICGLFDVASKFGINVPAQNFGSTLAYYGASTGPYLMLPFFGPTSFRDMLDVVLLNKYTNAMTYTDIPSAYQISATVLNVVNGRAKSMLLSNQLFNQKADPYIIVRNAYHCDREAKIKTNANQR